MSGWSMKAGSVKSHPSIKSAIWKGVKKRLNRPHQSPLAQFQFLALPREVRDLVYDYTIAGHPKLVVKHPRLIVESAFSRIARPSEACEGVYGLLLLNKQVSTEFREALNHTVPHHLRIAVDHVSSEQNPLDVSKDAREARKQFLAPVRFLYLHLYYYAKDTLMSDANLQLDLVLRNGFLDSLGVLKECTKTTDIVVDCAVWMSSRFRDPMLAEDQTLTHLLCNTVIELVEALPRVSRYAVQVLMPAARGYTVDAEFAARRQGVSWSGDVVVRHSTPEHPRATRPPEWEELYSFLHCHPVRLMRP